MTLFAAVHESVVLEGKRTNVLTDLGTAARDPQGALRVGAKRIDSTPVLSGRLLADVSVLSSLRNPAQVT